ncbi:bifunctional metallophosphatase/5'-nucleotidase [Alicyclobacillus mengziensis]|uniref:5'-nucleotidase C-terminal domain-containing protein n=1 Tax=Alicyclobacillus mengziensis TaxID=2931921 RepID=A0A9X7Z8H2_9BACL|nr:5'-nucleotidase C-terminal domain-containing protein [Alicyclobacillus mengziensis]QSO48211.1 5'-nucleotidase C-terminal domain-containing protein [Alicyclobacillus mengziensis]
MSMKIHILHMNDVHSHLENQMRVGYQLRRLRESLSQRGEPVLTFDIGDVLDRVRPETEASLGRLNAALLGSLSVDGWVFGNNEGLTIPRRVWPELVAASGGTVYGTNIRDESGSPLAELTDVFIYDLKGIQVGVFGVTPSYPKPYEHLGVQVLDPVVESARAVRMLQQMGAHIIVALSHLGLGADHSLAKAVPGIHLILGGHTHQLMDEPVYEGQTAIFQVGKHGVAFGHTTLVIDDATHQLQMVEGRAVLPTVLEKVDAQMMQVYLSHWSEIDKDLDRVVCELADALKTSLDEESSFANTLAGILQTEYCADVGIVVSGLLCASLLQGVVRRRHLHSACPTPTRPVLIDLSGAELWRVFERGLQPGFCLQRGFGFGFRGSVVGHLGLSNVRLEAHREVDDKVVVDEVVIGSERLVKTRIYRVATVEYLWLSSVLPEVHEGNNVDIPPPLVRDLLMERMNHANIVRDARFTCVHIRL